MTTFCRRLWNGSPLLATIGLLMLVTFAACIAGLWFDPRVITGVPAWLKPAKFAISTAIYALTLAWVFGHLPAWPRMRRVVGWMTAIVFVLEVGIIAMQAWRGTTSHFNVGTPGNAILFTVMGVAIVLQTLASIAVAVALWRERFADRALGWALRLGMTITIVGASTGGLMTAPTAAQLADARATHRMAFSGAHTVGGPDGGPGLSGTGWSREHGDVRVPHFLGLHALQALLLLALLLTSLKSETRRVRLTLVAAGSYLALFIVLLIQALRGEALIAPSDATAVMLAGWLLVTATAVWFATGRPAATRGSAIVPG